MDPYDLLAFLARDGEAFADLADQSDLTLPVPACPGWTLADLVWHLAEVHHFWRTIVEEQRDTWEGYVQPPRPADHELAAFFRDGLEATVTVLAAAHPEQANWTWSHQRDAGFVMRRMAHETAMHLWDAQLAVGREQGVDAELASDGIDEFLDHFLGPDPVATGVVGGSVHLHCTDVAGEWTVRPQTEGGFAVAREHARGDAALRGPASELLLVLWRRRPLDAVDVVGDSGVAQRFVAHAALD